MANIGSLVVDLRGSTAQFSRDMGKANQILRGSVTKMQRDVEGLRKGFSLVGRALGTLGIGLVTTDLVGMARRALDAAGGLGELAQQVGVSTTALQALRFAAIQGGVSAQELETGLAMLTNKIGEANENVTEAQRVFVRLGVSFKNADGSARRTEDVLTDVMGALQGTSDAARKASAAKDLFGRSGQKLLPVLDNNNQKLSDFIATAERAGVVLSEEMIAKADTASDKWAAFDYQIDQFATTATLRLLPVLEGIVGWLNKIDESNPDFFFNRILQNVPTSEGGFRAPFGRPPQTLTVPAPSQGGGVLPPTVTTDQEKAINDALKERDKWLQSVIDKMEERVKLEQDYQDQRQRDLAQLQMEATDQYLEKITEAAEERAAAMQELTHAAEALSASLANSALGFQEWEDFGKTAVDTVFSLLFNQLRQLETFGGPGGGMFSGLNLFGGGSGGGFNFASLFGFQHGGSFAVGGAGGADSQLVAFRATPGEHVSVSIPGGSGGGSTYMIDARGADKRGLRRLERMIVALDGSIEHRAVGASINAQRTSVAHRDVFRT